MQSSHLRVVFSGLLLLLAGMVMPTLAADTNAPSVAADVLIDDFDGHFVLNRHGGNGDRGGIGTVALSAAQAHSGKQSLCWTYDFSKDGLPSPGLVYARCFLETKLPGHPQSFSVWVYAPETAAGFRMNYRISDATGRIWQNSLGTINWTGWKQLTGKIDPSLFHWGGKDTPDGGFSYPVAFSELLIEGGKAGNPAVGSLYVDDFRVQGVLPPNELISTNVVSTWTDHIGVGSDPGVSVQVRNLDAHEHQLNLSWTLTDIAQRSVSGTKNLTVAADATINVPVPLRLHRGYYEMTVTVNDPAQPTVKNERTFSLASVPPVDPAIDPSSPIGVNGHSSGLHMKSLGVGFTRTDWAWVGAEPKPDVWNFDFYDRTYNEITKNGLDMLPILGYNPFWVKPAAGQGTDHAAFLESVRRTVERYKGRVRYWDLWNEPDGTWKGGKQEFGDLAYEAYKIIKQADPKAIVVYPGCADGDFHSQLQSFTIPSLASFGGKFPFDVLAVHPYTRPKSPDERQMREKLLNLRQWMAANGQNKPIWISECGWPTATDSLSVSEELQAAYLARLFIIGLSAGVQKIVYYQPFSGTNKNDPESEFGFLRNDFSPKPAAAALALVSYRLHKAKFDREIPLGSALHCYVFRTATEMVATVYAVGLPVD
ncbi:MAG TPA: cellulase family glycosylhydrolase, partial [Armatimonadota bacterium]|nr:cellulase family glycosylhydrolase [Armatimonadota bacterium]